MAYQKIRDFFLDVEAGMVANTTHNRKFGKNYSVGTTLTVISASGLYQCPTSAQSLEIVSSSANETSTGTAIVSASFDIYLK